jgi:hypothetical protein
MPKRVRIDKAFSLHYGMCIRRGAPLLAASRRAPRRTTQWGGQKFPGSGKKLFRNACMLEDITVWQAPCKQLGNVNAGEGR